MSTPPPRPTVNITSREKAMLILVAQGKTNKEIADAHDLAPNSVRTYLGTLRRKFGVHGHRATLALIAYRRRYVDPGTPEGEAPH